MNARGIPTAAYQVLHLLSCTGGAPPAGGYPHPDLAGGEVPHPGGYPISEGYPHLGYPPVWTWLGYPPSGPGRGTPHPIWTWLVYPPPQVWTDKQSVNITSRLVLCTRSVITSTLQNRKQRLEYFIRFIKFKRPLIRTRPCRKVDCVEQFLTKCNNQPLGETEEWRNGC